MQDTQAFGPNYKRSQLATTQEGTLFPSTTVASNEATATAGAIESAQNPGPTQLQISNLTSAWAFVNFGRKGVVVAATVAASYPVPPGCAVVVSVDPEVNGVSVILATAPSGSTSVIFTRGAGV